MKASRLRRNASKTQIMWTVKTNGHQRHTSLVDLCQGREHHAEHGCHHQQSTITLSTCRIARSGWILPASPATTNHSITVNRIYENTSPGVHIFLLGLLQFSATWSDGHSSTQPAINTKRGRTTHQWHTKTRLYQACGTSVALASSSTSHRVQGRVHSPPVVVWTSTWLPGWRLQACDWDRSTCSAVSQCPDMYGAASQNSTVTGVLRRQTAPVEHLVSVSAMWIQFMTVEDIIIRAPTPRRSVRVRYAVLCKFTYIRTYLLNMHPRANQRKNNKTDQGKNNATGAWIKVLAGN